MATLAEVVLSHRFALVLLAGQTTMGGKANAIPTQKVFSALDVAIATHALGTRPRGFAFACPALLGVGGAAQLQEFAPAC